MLFVLSLTIFLSRPLKSTDFSSQFPSSPLVSYRIQTPPLLDRSILVFCGHPVISVTSSLPFLSHSFGGQNRVSCCLKLILTRIFSSSPRPSSRLHNVCLIVSIKLPHSARKSADPLSHMAQKFGFLVVKSPDQSR